MISCLIHLFLSVFNPLENSRGKFAQDCTITNSNLGSLGHPLKIKSSFSCTYDEIIASPPCPHSSEKPPGLCEEVGLHQGGQKLG